MESTRSAAGEDIAVFYIRRGAVDTELSSVLSIACGMLGRIVGVVYAVGDTRCVRVEGDQ